MWHKNVKLQKKQFLRTRSWRKINLKICQMWYRKRVMFATLWYWVVFKDLASGFSNTKGISVGKNVLIRDSLEPDSVCPWAAIVQYSLMQCSCWLYRTKTMVNNENRLYNRSGLQLKELQETNCLEGGMLRKGQRQRDKNEDIRGMWCFWHL